MKNKKTKLLIGLLSMSVICMAGKSVNANRINSNDPVQRAQYYKAYYQKNRDRKLQYYQDNRKGIREKQAKYNQTHKEELKEKQKYAVRRKKLRKN